MVRDRRFRAGDATTHCLQEHPAGGYRMQIGGEQAKQTARNQRTVFHLDAGHSGAVTRPDHPPHRSPRSVRPSTNSSTGGWQTARTRAQAAETPACAMLAHSELVSTHRIGFRLKRRRGRASVQNLRRLRRASRLDCRLMFGFPRLASIFSTPAATFFAGAEP